VGTGRVISPDDLSIAGMPSELSGSEPQGAARMADYEAEAIRNALRQTSGSRREAARLLNISEATLYRRIRQYNI